MYIPVHVTKTLSGSSTRMLADETGFARPYAELKNACDALVVEEATLPTVEHDTWSTEYKIYRLNLMDCDHAIQESKKRARPEPEDPVAYADYRELLERYQGTLDKLRKLEKKLAHIRETVDNNHDA